MKLTGTDFDFEYFCRECHVPDICRFIAGCGKFHALLTTANRQFNLTRIDSENGFWLKHVADSLAIGRFFPELATVKLTLADIGCGAGFPALILALAYPQLAVTAIDSIGKKTAFAADAAKALGLDNILVVTGRTKELNRKAEWHGRFDVVTARAVADARTLYREARNFPKPGGKFIFYKTPEQAAIDLPQVSKASAQHDMRWQLTTEFSLPSDAGQRQFLHSVSSLSSLK